MCIFRIVIALMFVCVAGLAYSSNKIGRLEEGKNYLVLDEPFPPLSEHSIEMTVFFSYDCAHCYALEKDWMFAQDYGIAKDYGDKVSLVRSPVVWSKPTETYAKIHYTAESLGILDKVHIGLFKAILDERKRFLEEIEIEQFFLSFGIEKEQFKKAYKSFAVANKIKQAQFRARQAKITSVPTSIIGGKYKLDNSVGAGDILLIVNSNILIKHSLQDKHKGEECKNFKAKEGNWLIEWRDNKAIIRFYNNNSAAVMFSFTRSPAAGIETYHIDFENISVAEHEMYVNNERVDFGFGLYPSILLNDEVEKITPESSMRVDVYSKKNDYPKKQVPSASFRFTAAEFLSSFQKAKNARSPTYCSEK